MAPLPFLCSYQECQKPPQLNPASPQIMFDDQMVIKGSVRGKNTLGAILHTFRLNEFQMDHLFKHKSTRRNHRE